MESTLKCFNENENLVVLGGKVIADWSMTKKPEWLSNNMLGFFIIAICLNGYGQNNVILPVTESSIEQQFITAKDFIKKSDFKSYKKVLMFFPVGLLLTAFLCFLWMHKASFWDGFPLPEGYKVWTISQRAFVWFLISGVAVGITILLFRKSD